MKKWSYGDNSEGGVILDRNVLITERQTNAEQMDGFIEKMKRMDGFCPEFDEGLWCSLLDHTAAYTKDDVRFTFRGGMEIRV